MRSISQQWVDRRFETRPQAEPLARGELSELYDAAAATWHRKLLCLGYPSAYRRLLAGLVQEGSLPRQGSVLDCGIGSGAFCAALIDVTGTDWAVEGVDLSAQMMAGAQRRLAGRTTAISLHRCHASRLPQPASSMDLVVSAHMIEHATEPLLPLREMERVLRPGAPLVLLVTRPGVIGRYLASRWPIECWDDAKTAGMLTAAGFHRVRPVPLPPSLCRWSSSAWIGWKPSAPD